MSRSYKKTPMVKDKNKGAKKLANKKVRRYKGAIKNGGFYRKIFCSYDICDYMFSRTLEEYIERESSFLSPDEELDIKEVSRKWYTTYKMK